MRPGQHYEMIKSAGMGEHIKIPLTEPQKRVSSFCPYNIGPGSVSVDVL